MMPKKNAVSHHGHFQAQRGVALFAVMVIVLLSMLLALWASRSALFNEMMVGNDADYQRAHEAAQAMLQDAEVDIRYSSRANGVRFTNTDPNRLPHLPEEDEPIIPILSALKALPGYPKCRDALCEMREDSVDPDFWSDPVTLGQWKSAGARYGQYSGAAQISGGTSNVANPILKDRAWYWVEVGKFRQDDGDDPAEYPPYYLNPPLIYRITALAEGLKPGTRVVLQETYFNRVPQ